jgi:putative nucleotidyltransferase with HDIG domain
MIAYELAALAAALGLALAVAGTANWDLPLLGVLLVFSVISDLVAVDVPRARVKISGSGLAIAIAMVALGATPACLVGVTTMLAGSIRWRVAGHYQLNNLVAHAWFPLCGGLAFLLAGDALGFDIHDSVFYLAAFAAYLFGLAVNFSIVMGYRCYLEASSFVGKVRAFLVPLVSSDLAAGLLAIGTIYLYIHLGLATIVLLAVALLTFQRVLGQLLLSEDRADKLDEQGHQLRARTTQLASLQIGVLTALMRTLDLRDRMTARHCAAVARYSREIAAAAGLSEEEQELVHTASLLHDIGKFIFPDRILKGDTKLTDEDWQIVKMHPYQGARIVSGVDGYGPVGDIILAHHERVDGKGYPRGLAGEDIPKLSRIISIADTYDVMTARDSYREPVSSFEAIQELRRVSGAQLDGELVEIFVEILAGKDVNFRRGEDADFDAELNLDRRIRDYSEPVPGPVPGGRSGTPLAGAQA